MRSESRSESQSRLGRDDALSVETRRSQARPTASRARISHLVGSQAVRPTPFQVIRREAMMEIVVALAEGEERRHCCRAPRSRVDTAAVETTGQRVHQEGGMVDEDDVNDPGPQEESHGWPIVHPRPNGTTKSMTTAIGTQYSCCVDHYRPFRTGGST